MITPNEARTISSAYPTRAQIDEELKRVDIRVRDAAARGYYDTLFLYDLLPAVVSHLRANGYTVDVYPEKGESRPMVSVKWGDAILRDLS